MMIFLSSIILLGMGLLQFGKASYFWELAISFLPYWGALLFLFLWYWLFLLWKRLHSAWVKLSLRSKLSPFFVWGFAIVFLLFVQPLLHFYQQPFLHREELKAPIRILFSNLYKDNPNIEQIKEKILTEDPDLVMFVEFSDLHKQELESFFDEHYPYMNMTTRSKILVGSVVFSKYPISNLADDFEQWSRRYGYFKVEKEGQPYYFYELHTSSPVSSSFFHKRNRQLQQLKNEFLTLHSPQRPQDAKIIMLWDFNVSPRSVYYQQFASGLSGKMENLTRSFSLLFTWSLSEMLAVHQDFDFLPDWLQKSFAKLPFLRSHIDHLFVSPSVKVHALRRIHFEGSDHWGFLFEAE